MNGGVVESQGCLYEGRKILEGGTNFYWVCIQKVLSVWCPLRVNSTLKKIENKTKQNKTKTKERKVEEMKGARNWAWQQLRNNNCK